MDGVIYHGMHPSPQYLLQDSLEPNEYDSHIRLLDKIRELPAAQAERAERLIDTMAVL